MTHASDIAIGLPFLWPTRPLPPGISQAEADALFGEVLARLGHDPLIVVARPDDRLCLLLGAQAISTMQFLNSMRLTLNLPFIITLGAGPAGGGRTAAPWPVAVLIVALRRAFGDLSL